jgi:hypothetical protein
MKHKGIRITLVVIELFVGLWAVIGGVGLVTGTIPFLQMPVEYLQGTPFSDYTIPALLLLLVVGGSFLFAAATILTGREVDVLASALAGLIVIGFEVVEVPIIDRYANTLATAVPQQIIMSVLGLACFGLAMYLWLTEYRSHSFLTRQKQETTAFRFDGLPHATS